MSNTEIQALHNYHQTSKLLDISKRKELKELLGITEDDEKRLVGLDNEDEFIVILYALEWVKSFSGIEEGIAQVTKTKTTDFFVETVQGRKLSIEVKSSKDHEISFTRNLVEEKEEFSRQHSHECFFAIKLAGLWMLFSSEYILKRGCKISLEKDYFKSEMNEIFGERLFLFQKGLEIVTTYSKSKEGICGIKNEYGNAVRIAVKVNGKRKFLISSNNSSYVFLSIVLETIENAMSNQEQIVTRKDNDETIVIERLKENLFVRLSNILTAPILHTMNTELEENYSFPTYIEEMKKKGHQNLLSRKLVLGALSLFDDEYPIAISFNNKEFYLLKDMQIDE